MRTGVIARNDIALFLIHLQLYCIPYTQLAFLNDDMGQMLLMRSLDCRIHDSLYTFCAYRTAVTNLTAAFRIEDRCIKHRIAFITDGIHLHTVLKQCNHLRRGMAHIVADEAALLRELHQINGLASHGLRISAGSTGTLSLLLHLSVKAVLIHCISAFLRDFHSQLQREPIGIIQLKRSLAVNDTAFLLFFHYL